MGTIIGLGILRTPGEIASTIQDPWVYMALWVAGGVFVLLSTLVAAELISITPKSGGLYSLVEKAFGPYPGFLIGWTDWLAQAASGALKAVVLMEYAALLLPALKPWVTPGALLINAVFAALQLGGVKLGGRVHQVAATLFGLILISVSMALLFGDGANTWTAGGPLVIDTATGWANYGIVAAGIVFTYDGWISASYYSAEIDGGGRSVARGSIKGVLIVIALYLLLNGLLVMNVPLEVLDGEELAIASALEFLYGPGSGAFIVFAALFILMAHQNVQYMASSRTLYALSVDGLGTRRATGVSHKGTPTGALFFTWLLMQSLILVGGFKFLLNMSALLFIIGYVAIMAGVFRMRRRAPGLERPVRAWGFPVSGIICMAGWILIALFVGLMDLKSSAYAAVLTLVSIPVYLWLKSRRNI